MNHPTIFRTSLLQYAYLRSAVYTLEGFILPTVELLASRKLPRLPFQDWQLFKSTRKALADLLEEDIRNISWGLYPAEVLRPESPVQHLLRMPELLREGYRIARRRAHRQTREFDQNAEELLRDVPEYYRRNYHFQGDGYLSRKSARLYDHQVEVLFAGAADAMRRLIIAPMKQQFPQGDGAGLTFLELGAGTGHATRFVRLAFPQAKIVCVDLSAPYLKLAQEHLRDFHRHDFVEADAAKLPFQGELFDAVYSVFLFHELPLNERSRVVSEAMRVLRPGGFFGLVDSLQLGDEPELEPALRHFPRDFHEPFYANYIKNPLENVMRAYGVRNLQEHKGFVSKVCWGKKSERGISH